MEGVARGKVRLLPHQTEWAQEFRLVAEQIRAAWAGNMWDIQHVGSTAVPGIRAKPILDVAVLLRSVRAMDVAAMEHLGYEYCGPREGRETYHLFVLRSPEGLSLRHIHCYDAADTEFSRLVGFRDYLNAHPDTAARYEALKMALAAKYPDDRVAYTAGKAAFIQSVYARLED